MKRASTIKREQKAAGMTEDASKEERDYFMSEKVQNERVGVGNGDRIGSQSKLSSARRCSISSNTFLESERIARGDYAATVSFLMLKSKSRTHIYEVSKIHPWEH